MAAMFDPRSLRQCLPCGTRTRNGVDPELSQDEVQLLVNPLNPHPLAGTGF